MTGPRGAGDPIHPCEILQTEFLGPHGLSRARLARATGFSSSRLARLTQGRSRISGEVALLLGRAFLTTPEFWMSLQANYDLECAQATLAPAQVARARALGGKLRRARAR